MPVTRVEEFGAFEFAGEFNAEVNELIKHSPQAQRAFKFRDQLEDAAGGIERSMAEGFARRNAAEFATFLRYSLGSLAEAVQCLRQGIDRGYFMEAGCQSAFTWGARCKTALRGLHASQIREAAKRRDQRSPRPSKPSPNPPTPKRRGKQ